MLISGKLNSPVSVGITTLDVDNKMLTNLILSKGDEMDRQTNLKADMTKWRLTEDHPELEILAERIVKEGVVPYLIEKYTKNDYDAEDEVKRQTYAVVDIWGGVYNKGDYADPHDHRWVHTAFCYYVKAPKNCAPLVFNTIDLTVQPEESMLILFDGFLEHMVPIEESDESRIVIAGNVAAIPGNIL